MTCENFEFKFCEMLNGMLSESEAAEIAQHRATCPKCAEIASEIESINGRLQNLPAIELRPKFREKLHRVAIRECSTFVSWRPYILRWFAIVVPVSLAFALGRFSPGFPWEVAQTIILLGACLTFVPEWLKLKMRFRGYMTLEQIEEELARERSKP
jgi:anti-sigma factor RsiW